MDKIKVAVRSRPLNKRELNLESAEAVVINDNQVVLTNIPSNKDGRKSTKTFAFDCCFDSSSSDKANFASQETVYKSLGTEIIENAFAGYNACIFAYGQTGSGKSYTMTGNEENKGLIPRICEALFQEINTSTDIDCTFKVEVSYMEIYNEKCRDLLNPSQHNLKVREHQLLGAYVESLSHLAVSSFKDIEVLINEGNKSRTIAATNMNSESSRSHAVFCVKVSQNILDKKSGISGEKVSRLSLIDLAGSEKVSKTGSEGERLKEGCNINRSLLTLGTVISALAENANTKSKPKHIPYRDSVLTWLLKDSLGGNSKTVMVTTISTAYDNYDETLSTLRYADRAKKIVNNAVVNEDPNAKIIRNLREELEMLKIELEKAKEKINSDTLSDRLKESESLYNEMSKPWTEKLADSEKVQQELSNKLQTMGISVQSSGISVEKNRYYLVNINPDPSMNELLVYYLKDLTLVGRPDAKTKQDIQLIGPGIAFEHCAFYMKNSHVCLTPIKSAKTRVNGYLITEETLLQHGDRIEMGINHFFRINCPLERDNPNSSNLKHVSSLSEFNFAQEEVLMSKLVKNVDDEGNHLYNNKSPESSDSIDENSVNLEYAVRKFEKNFASNYKGHMTTSSSTSSLEDYTITQTRKGLIKLREQLLHANSLAREANSICKEINENIRFSITLRIPAKNLTPNRKRESLLSEPAILVKKNTHRHLKKTIIDFQNFDNFIINLREIYSEKNKSQEIATPQNVNIGSRTSELLYDYESSHNLIGVANVFLDSLFIETCILFEYDVPILSQQGEISGLLKVKLQRIDTDKSQTNESQEVEENDPSQQGNSQKKIRFKLWINEAIDLPVHLNNSVFCKYQFWANNKSFIVPSKLLVTQKQSLVKFEYENEFCIDLSEEFIEYCMDGALSIEVFGQKEEITPYIDNALMNHDGPKKYAEAIEKYNQMIKYQSLIDCWSEVSKAIEMHVQIHELNTEGNWSPVDVKIDNDSNMTGGIYQLKQGQSRQISVRVNQTKSNNIMWYNGVLFNLEPHRIEKISVGCVTGKESGITQPLDSYQDIDLNRLREKCKEILETRKQYLYSQLSLMSNEVDKQTEDEKERYESLCKQLVNLGEEQAALDAPEDNSNLPGSTIEWEPANGMEKHVPIVFLDIDEDCSGDNDLSGDLNLSDDYYEEDFESQCSTSNSYKKWNYENGRQVRNENESRTMVSCGQDCYLKHEHRDMRFVDLKLIRWNDSSLVEMVANDEYQTNDIEPSNMDYVDTENEDHLALKALSLWDSTIHQSPYLNQITPIDRDVYLTIKINLKLKLLCQNKNEPKSMSQKYVDLALRKRIAVNVSASGASNSGNKFGLMRFKNLLGGGSSNSTKNLNNINMTSVIYRLISSVPKALVEIENRESLALQAANTLANNAIDDQKFLDKPNSNKLTESLDSSLTQFHNYAKTIAAVDSLLRQDHVQQQTAIKAAGNILHQSMMNSTTDPYDSNSFSVPGLLKTGFESIINLSPLNATPANDSHENSGTAAFSRKIDLLSITSEAKTRLATMGTQLIDTAKANNLSFTKLLELPQDDDPEAVIEELRRLELEIEEAKKNKENEDEMRYEDIPVIPTNKLNLEGLDAKSESSDFIVKMEDTISESNTEKSTEKAQSTEAPAIHIETPKEVEETKPVNKPHDKFDTKISNMLKDIDEIKSNINQHFTDEKKTNENPSENLEKKEKIALKESKKADVLEVKPTTNLNASLSNISVASTLTNMSMQTNNAHTLESLPDWVRMDAHVIVSTNSIQNKPGYIKFIGNTKFAHGTWIGVELEQAFGKNDGSLKGVRYFRCPEEKGCFVRADKLSLVVNKI